jgi:hypothetical protein
MVWMSSPQEPGALVLAVALSGPVAVPLGLAVASVFPRELEGALTLIAVVGIEMGLPVDSGPAPFLPLWGPLKLVVVARGADEGLTLPVLHALTSAVALLAISATLWMRRVRVTRHATP